jgi:Spy/CpxP family protein refolding chaperone
MVDKLKNRILNRGGAALAFMLSLAVATASAAQQTAPANPQNPPAGSSTSSQPQGNQGAKSATHITPEQAQQLFALVDELQKFASQETGLPIKSTVKRQMTTRAAVEAYLEKKFNEDESAKRLQRDEIVLKKFGLLDRDFELKPFLLALLKEQIEAYYDSKTKTVNLLDWVDPDEQKPVMAHELTHALQDQHSDLEKWDDQTPDDVSTNAAGDEDHLAKDEIDTARDAVAEGQATAVMFDYILKPLGKSLIKDPEVLDIVKAQMNSSTDSPVMARAPLLLSESLLFPYREGLSFEQDVWMDQGQPAAFAGALDRPPTSSWEIINPRVYEEKRIPAIPLLPDIHPLVDSLYRPYDIGQIGELDVHIITELFGGDASARDMTPAWDGGLYWAGQLRSTATPAELDSTKSLALFYLSAWKSADSAQTFAKLYANNLGRKYASVQNVSVSGATPAGDGSVEQVFSTNEGPVVITTRGKMVFVAESFPLPLARKLTALILDAQGGGGAMRMTSLPPWPGTLFFEPPSAMWAADSATVAPSFPPLSAERVGSAEIGNPLSGDLVRFFGDCGVMKNAVDAMMRAESAHTSLLH